LEHHDLIMYVESESPTEFSILSLLWTLNRSGGLKWQHYSLCLGDSSFKSLPDYQQSWAIMSFLYLCKQIAW